MSNILKDLIKIGYYRLTISSIYAYYPGLHEDFDTWCVVIERIIGDGISELIIDFETEDELNSVLIELDKLLTIDPMNLRKEKLEEIKQNNK